MGESLDDLPEHQDNLETLARGGSVWGFTTPAAYLGELERVASLAEEIGARGLDAAMDYGVHVEIRSRGEIVALRGAAAVMLARLLGIETIPVTVTHRHREWARLRRAVLRIIAERGFFHQPFSHPDIDGLPARFGNHMADSAMYGHERWTYITEHLEVETGTVLDIGAYFGYFCHRFEERGYRCFAVENNRLNLRVLRRYRRMMDRRFTVWAKSIFEVEESEFDVVLALNVFHHLVRYQDSYEKLIAFLKRLRCRVMIFETGRVSGYTYVHLSPEECIELIFEHTNLSTSKLLGRAREGRDVFLLSSGR